MHEMLLALAFFGVSGVATQGAGPADVEGLLRKLASDSAEERSAASRQLLDLEEKAIPALEGAAKSTDAELQGAAQGLLIRIAGRVRSRPYRPGTLRVSVEFENQKFGEALSRITKPFGMNPPRYAPALEDQLLSHRLAEASLWEHLEAFCKKSGCTLEPLIAEMGRAGFEQELFVVPQRAPYPYVQHRIDHDVRITLDSGATSRADRRAPWKSVIAIQLTMPPGAWVERSRLVEVVLKGENGQRLTFEHAAPRIDSFICDRRRGLPTRVVAGTVSFIPGDLNPPKELSIEGKIEIEIPEEVEVMSRAKISGAPSLTLPGILFKTRWDAQGRTLDVHYSGMPREGGQSLQIGAFDPAGEWLFDLGPFRFEPGRQEEGETSFKSEQEPNELRLWKASKTRTRTIPFSFAGVVYNAGGPGK